jgi:RNA transcription, translation and transport factor protein
MVQSVHMLLRALQHPQADSVQLDALRNLVPWLEDRKIRAYKVEDRPALASAESPDWQSAYDRVSTIAASSWVAASTAPVHQ